MRTETRNEAFVYVPVQVTSSRQVNIRISRHAQGGWALLTSIDCFFGHPKSCLLISAFIRRNDYPTH